MNVQVRYIVYFLPEQSIYTFIDCFMPRPMRRVSDDEIVAYCSTLTAAHLVTDSLNAVGYI